MIWWTFLLLLLIPQDLLAKQLPQDPLSEELTQDLLAKQLPQDPLAEELPQDPLGEQLQLPNVPGCEWDETNDADASKYQTCVDNQVTNAGVIINAIINPASIDNVDSALKVVQSALDVVGLLSPELGAVFGLAHAIFGGGSGDDKPPAWVNDIISRLDIIEKHLDEIENDIRELGVSIEAAICRDSITEYISTIESIGISYDVMFSDHIRDSREELNIAQQTFNGRCSDLSEAIVTLINTVDSDYMSCADTYFQENGYMSKKFYRNITPVLVVLVRGVRYLQSCVGYNGESGSEYFSRVRDLIERLKTKIQHVDTIWMTNANSLKTYSGHTAAYIREDLEKDGSFDHEYSIVTFESTTRRDGDFAYFRSGSNDPREGMVVAFQPEDGGSKGKIGLIFYKWKNLTNWGKEVSAWTNPDHPGSCEAMCTTTDTHWWGGHSCGQHSCGDAWHMIRAPHDRGNGALNNDLYKAPGTAMMKVAHQDSEYGYIEACVGCGYAWQYYWKEKQDYSHPVISNNNTGNYNLIKRQIGPEPTEDGGYFNKDTGGFTAKYYYVMVYPLKGSKAPCTAADRGDPIATGVGCCKGLGVNPAYEVEQTTATAIGHKCSTDCTKDGESPYRSDGSIRNCCAPLIFHNFGYHGGLQCVPNPYAEVKDA